MSRSPIFKVSHVHGKLSFIPADNRPAVSGGARTMAGAGTAMARYSRAREPPKDEGALTLSSAVAAVTYPVRATLSMLHEAVPFTKKGAMVLLKVRSKRGGCSVAAWRRLSLPGCCATPCGRSCPLHVPGAPPGHDAGSHGAWGSPHAGRAAVCSCALPTLRSCVCMCMYLCMCM
jgi:hypothetical protein